MALNYNAIVNIDANFTGQKAVESANKSLKDVHDSSEKLNEKVKELIKEALAPLAAAFALEKVFEFGKSIIELGDQLSKLKEKTGISVDVLSELKGAAEHVGVPFENLSGSLKKFSAAVAAASSGSVAQISAFKNIGISVSDLKSNDPGELLLKIADRFSKLEDGPGKAAASLKIFGKSGTEWIPVLNQGSDAVKRFGIGITDDFADRARVFNETLADMKITTEKLGVAIITELLPTFQEIAKSFSGPSDTSGVSKFADYFAETFRVLALVAKEASNGIVVGFDAVETLLESVGERIAYVLSISVDTISTLASEAKSAATGHFNEIARLDEEQKARAIERDKKYDEDQEKRATDFSNRTLARAKTLRDSEALLAKNSLLLGEGTTKEILARQRADTAPEEKKKATEKVNGGSEEKQKEIDAILNYKAAQEKLIGSQLDQLDAANMTTVAFKKLSEQRKLEADEQIKTVGYTEQGRAAFHELTVELIAQNDELINLQEAQKESYGAGAQQALHDYLEAAKDVASQSKKAFSDMFSGMENALVKFVETGKLSFADLAKTIEDDLLHIAIKQAIVFGISSVAGAFSGGSSGDSGGLSSPSLGSQYGGGSSFGGALGTYNYGSHSAMGNVIGANGPMPLSKFANGGVVNSPHVALFGEGSTPEAFVPLPDGRNIPVKMAGNSSGGTSVVVNVNISNDGESETSNSSAEKGKKIGALVSVAVRSAILNEKRPGGLLA